MVIDMRSRTRSAFPRRTRPRTATPPSAATERAPADSAWSTITCDDCAMDGTVTCHDCVVTFLCGTASDFDDHEADTLRLFQAAGLAPALRHVARTSLVQIQQQNRVQGAPGRAR